MKRGKQREWWKERGRRLAGPRAKKKEGKEGRKVKQKEKINTGSVGTGNQNMNESQAAARLSAEWEHEDTEPGNSKLMQPETERERELVH